MTERHIAILAYKQTVGSMAMRHTQPTHVVYIKGPNTLEQEMFHSWATGIALQMQKGDPNISWTFTKQPKTMSMRVSFTSLQKAQFFEAKLEQIQLPTAQIQQMASKEAEQKKKWHEISTGL